MSEKCPDCGGDTWCTGRVPCGHRDRVCHERRCEDCGKLYVVCDLVGESAEVKVVPSTCAACLEGNCGQCVGDDACNCGQSIHWEE